MNYVSLDGADLVVAETKTSRSWAVEQSASTRRQLIMAGMRLMAEKGIDGVSLRSVNVAAGARNASAAHYHFGSKLALVEAIVETLEQDVSTIRAPLIDTLRARSATETLTAREIIEAAYLPFMGLLFHAEYGLPGIRFLSRLIVDTGPELRVVANTFTAPLAEDVFELLSKALPDVPARVLKFRILYSLINLINGMSDMLALQTSPFGDMSTPGSLEAADHFIEYVVAGISAPPSSMSEEFVSLSGSVIEQYRSSSRDPSNEQQMTEDRNL